MFKELKYLFYLLIIFLFIFFISKYYFSDQNKKKSYRSLASLDKKINEYVCGEFDCISPVYMVDNVRISYEIN